MTTQQAARDLVTPDSGAAPVVSIVVPCLNERVTVGEFVDWCFEGLADAGVTGEILIVDSSTDESPEIAAERGALVVSVPKRGLGRAYVDALPHVKGRIVIMGDCDLTYDFRQLKPFIEAVDAGHEFVMGTRTRGEIEAGGDACAAPVLWLPAHDADVQHHLRHAVQRHPLRDAGLDHATR